MSTLGDRIKEVRESLKLTGEEFGKKLNVTKVAVSNWENGNRNPDIEMIAKIAKLGDVTIDYLSGETNVRERNNSNSLFNGSGHTRKSLNILSDNVKKDINKEFTLEYALKILKENHDNLESKEDRSAAETTLSILNALIDTGALSEDNWNEDTLNIIKSAINMYIKNRKKTTPEK